MSTENTILLATDYSPAAQNAAVYALHLARHLGAHLELIHAYIIPFAYTDNPMPLINIEEIQEIAEDSMETEIKRLQNMAPSASISSKLVPGDIADCLAEIIEEKKPLLVIMGTSGSGSDSLLWGSMAVKALRNLKAPVLAVPTNATWKPVEKICFAADYNHVNEKIPVAEIIGWAQKVNASLNVLHIEREETIQSPPSLLVNLLQEVSPQYHTIVAENIEDGIATFLEQQDIGWLLVIPGKYGFFESIFHKSKTKLLTRVSNIPILALHQE